MIALLISRARNSLLLKNSTSLFLVQIGTFLIPLIITPYLARVLGVGAFGEMAIAIGLASYFTVLVEWGFQLGGPQEVAQNRDDPDKLNEIFWSVTIAKTALLVVSFAIICVIGPFWGIFNNHLWVVAAATLQVISSVLQASWYLQGLENIMRPSIYGLLVRLLVIPATLLFVRSPNDVAIAVAIQGAASIGAALVTLGFANSIGRVFKSPRLQIKPAIAQLRSNSILFASMGAMSLFTYANVIVLGAMAGSVQAAIFNGADRVRRAGQQILSPLSSAFYPRINNLMVHSRESARRVMLTLFVAQVSAGAVIAIGVALCAPWIVAVLLGPEFKGSVVVLQILAAVIVISAISNTLGTNMLLPMGLKSTFTIILVATGVLNILLLVGLIPIAGAIGAAIAVLITECVIALSKAIMIYRFRARLTQAPPPT